VSEPVSNSYKLGDLTTGEAEAFRVGFEAAKAAAADKVEELAEHWHEWAAGELAASSAFAIRGMAPPAAICAMEPPA
jgi:hypothetical protein